MSDLASDLVELAPYVPPAEAVRLREVAFRGDSWLPAEDNRLRSLFAADVPVAAIAAAIGRPLNGIRTRIWVLGLRRNSNVPWNEIEDSEVARRYGDEPTAAIAGDLGRAVTAVYARAHFLGLSQPRPPLYSEWEDAQLRAGFAADVPVAQIAALLGRTAVGVASRASDLGLRHPSTPPNWTSAEVIRALELAESGMLYSRIRRRLIDEGFPPRSKQGFGSKLRGIGYGRGWGRPWTAEEEEMIRRAYGAGDSIAALGLRLGRTPSAMSWKARELGLTGTHEKKAGFRQGPDWTEDQTARLKEAYGKVPMKQLAEEIGRPIRAIYVRAHHLGLKANYNDRFTPDQDEEIRQAIVADKPLRDLCRPLGRNIDSIQRRAKRLGLA